MHTLRLTLAVPVIAFSLLASYLSFAQTTKADVVSISPPRYELFGNPGDIINEKLKVRNDGTSDLTYQTDVRDFTASGEEGGIDINDDPNAPKSNFSLARWMVVQPSRFTVPAGQEKIIDIGIRIPKNAESGGHYASVQVVSSGANLSGSGASVQSNLNSLILLRVSGDITEKLTAKSFHAEFPYYQTGPVSFLLTTQNSGNVHVAPSGTITITDMFGRKVKEIPLIPANVLPNSFRTIKTVFTDTSMIGRFTATLVANYGSGAQKQPITGTTTFIVVPLYLIWILIALIVIIFLGLTQRSALKRLLHNLTSD